MKPNQLSLLLFFVFVSFSSLAFADFNRNYTIGFGVHSGYMSGGGELGNDSRFVYGVNAKARFFKFLGTSFSYDFNPSKSTSGNISIPYPTMALTGHLYLFNVKRVSFNLLGGVGFDVQNGLALSSYHIGAELDIQITKKLVLSASFRFLTPTVDAVKGNIEKEQQAIVNQSIKDAQNNKAIDIAVIKNSITFDYVLGKVFDPNNFRVGLSLRFFL